MALEAFDEAEKAARSAKVKAPDGTENYRLRVEHAQVTNPAEVVRFRELKIIASMQPCHLLTDMRWAESRLGAARAEHSYAWAEFLNHGVPLAFGTDYPVEPINPFRGLYAAITRKNEAGTKEYFPEDKLTIEQDQPLPPEILKAGRRDGVSYAAERPSPNRAVYSLDRAQ